MLLKRVRLASLLALGLATACAAPQAVPPPVGAISWEEALALLRSGSVRQVSQTHAQDVRIVTETGASYTAREPRIDEILRAVRSEAPNASQIVIVTE
jgi:hypothetical protein